jgi:hypothetical protein
MQVKTNGSFMVKKETYTDTHKKLWAHVFEKWQFGCAETTQVWQLQALILVKEHGTQVLNQPQNGWWCILQEMICVLHIMDNSAFKFLYLISWKMQCAAYSRIRSTHKNVLYKCGSVPQFLHVTYAMYLDTYNFVNGESKCNKFHSLQVLQCGRKLSH